jgi:hypothetical protein
LVAKGNPRTGGVRFQRSVLTLTLDWLAQQISPPDLVKVDVEGAEHRVLLGARTLVAGARPRFIIEIAPENNLSIAAVFAEWDYVMFDASRPELGPRSHPAWNTLAVPRERAEGTL